MSLDLESSRDLWLTGGEMTLEGREVTGPTSLCQRLERALNTPTGSLRYYPNRGYSVPRQVLSNTPLWSIRAGIEHECKQDEQVSDAAALVIRRDDGSLDIKTAVTSPAFGTFAFTMTATDAAATLVALLAQ